ncbi:MerR family transcriptional regulator [Nocardia bovistercoris]|uniref:MerR family transcriptional regulator n=1 Tax=Nocardia bovistercoris TaxID=2785916 RepID=A0A931IAN0_9NOCA|nr:MerR family transcriptional regulator [Nocardia bovistercoris]MBH0776955.1 MerR family transcriptional regulator [Nocardia bovistercoris]
MRIGDLARRAQTTTRTLRYYESRGLLTARRDDSGYRVYDEADVLVLHQIKTLQDCGFDLEDIRPFVDCLRAGYPSGDSCPASSEVYRRKLVEIEDRMARLRDVHDWIRTRLDGTDFPASLLDGTRRPPADPPRCELAPDRFRRNG